MPLETSIRRNGRALKLRWSGFHVAAMVCAVSWDSGNGPFVDNAEPEPETHEPGTGHYITPSDAFRLMDYGVIACTPLNHDGYKLTRGFVFVDCTDGEVLTLKPGDVLTAYRGYK